MKYEDKIYAASDYAGFTSKEFSFYYGYEEVVEEDGKELWAFTVFKEGKQVFRKGIDQHAIKFDCYRGLLAGMAYFLDEVCGTKGSSTKAGEQQ